MPRQLDFCSEAANMTIETWATVALGRSAYLSRFLRLFLASTTKLFLLFFWTAQSSIYDSAGLALPSLDWRTPQVKSGGSSSSYTTGLNIRPLRQTSAKSLTRLGSAASGRSLKSRVVWPGVLAVTMLSSTITPPTGCCSPRLSSARQHNS